jgi:hypothetical protein
MEVRIMTAKRHLDLKDILHKIVEHLDLSPADRAALHESVQLHDDPAAQAEKDRGDDAEREAKRAALQAELDALEPAPAPAAPADVSRETDDVPVA